jgi:hypothetical protein
LSSLASANRQSHLKRQGLSPINPPICAPANKALGSGLENTALTLLQDTAKIGLILLQKERKFALILLHSLQALYYGL